MLALRKTRAAPGVQLSDVFWPDGAIPAGEVEIAVQAAGICGSDLHAFHWDAGYAFMADVLPVTIGHEFAGRVVARGEGVTLSEGDRVVCWPTLTCGDCAACLAGMPTACRARRIVGLHRDGGFAPRVRVPAQTCRPIPDTLPVDLAALAEPLAIAINAVDQADVRPGDRVVVLGPGPIGAGAAWVAAERGAEIALVGRKDAHRLALARELGLRATADLEEVDLAEAVAAAFDREPDRVIEATGAAVSVERGFDILRPGGTLVATGIHTVPAEIDLSRLVREKKRLVGAHDTTAAAFDAAIAYLDTRGDVLGRLITHRLPLADGLRAFEIADDRTAMKVLLMPEEITDPEGPTR